MANIFPAFVPRLPWWWYAKLLDPVWRVEIEMDAVISDTETGAAPGSDITQ